MGTDSPGTIETLACTWQFGRCIRYKTADTLASGTAKKKRINANISVAESSTDASHRQ